MIINQIEEFDFEILSKNRKESKNGVPATVKPVRPAECAGGSLWGRSPKLTAQGGQGPGDADVSFSLSGREPENSVFGP